uniref:stalk domain-containing protein n=1 Tax=uncultured Tyzzerella sp. TaxID=2321398 RepID=UPI00294356C8
MKKLFKLMISSFIISSLLLNTVNVFAQGQVRVSVGNKIASVNGENVTLDVAPYIQKPSESMMIPLRFVSTGLGIDENNIQFIPNTKEIIIKSNDTTIKFIAGSSKMSINEEIFDMGMKDSKTGKIDYIYTEIKNGSTFIPLRALETGLGIKIDWESSTKTAILTNENVSNELVLQGDINEDVKESNSNTSNTELTEQDIRAMEEEVVRLVNEERAKYGLQPL